MQEFLGGLIVGIVLAFIVTLTGFVIFYDNELKSVGIERIVSCSVDTTNCHSNWNEIVWIKK